MLNNTVQIKSEFLAMLDTISRVADSVGLPSLVRKIEDISREVSLPVRVALVGRISAGKSTLLNAIIGTRLAPTAVETKTLNVNCFRHVSRSPHQREEIRVVYNDGHERFLDLSYLKDIVSADENHRVEELTDVKLVECFIRHDSLLSMDIIDTPGLSSADLVDSGKTEELIGHISERPDILLYLYRNFSKKDLEEVMMFQRNLDSFSGMCTIGILAKADTLLPNTGDSVIGADYLVMANDLIRRQYTNKDIPEFRYHFCQSIPLAQVYAQAADALTADDYTLLKGYVLKSGLYRPSSFNRPISVDGQPRFLRGCADLDALITPELRSDLWKRLEPEALKYVAYYFLHECQPTYDGLKEALYGYSNVGELKRLLFKNFDERAIFYKVGSLVNKLIRLVRDEKNGKGQQALVALEKMEGVCLRFVDGVNYQFLPYFYLRDYYSNQGDYLPDDLWDAALRLFGELPGSEERHETDPAYWQAHVNRYKRLMLYSTASKLGAIASYCRRQQLN